MKIAVACDNNQISAHFGHCRQYLIANCADNKVVSHEYVTAPKHEPGVLPRFLHELGVNLVIVGGIGSKAVDLFNQRNIDVITGCSGDCLANVNTYLEGCLLSTNSMCAGHDNDENHQCSH